MDLCPVPGGLALAGFLGSNSYELFAFFLGQGSIKVPTDAPGVRWQGLTETMSRPGRGLVSGLDLDQSRFGFFSLGKGDVQNSVLDTGGNFLLVHGRWQSESLAELQT